MPKARIRMEEERHPVFISHATANDTFVCELRKQLEGLGVAVWVNSRKIRGFCEKFHVARKDVTLLTGYSSRSVDKLGSRMQAQNASPERFARYGSPLRPPGRHYGT